jgi:hypothetical protein
VANHDQRHDGEGALHRQRHRALAASVAPAEVVLLTAARLVTAARLMRGVTLVLPDGRSVATTMAARMAAC